MLSHFYFNQIELIRYISRSLPLNFKLYVKEHPGMRDKRPRSFYQEILKLPNVRLIDPALKTFAITRGAKLVTTITGTVGWEALLLNQPVITFGEAFYNALSRVKRVHNIETLPAVIREQLQPVSNPEALEKELVNFVAATLQDSFPFDYTKLWFETNPYTLRDHPHIANFCRRLMAKIRL